MKLCDKNHAEAIESLSILSLSPLRNHDVFITAYTDAPVTGKVLTLLPGTNPSLVPGSSILGNYVNQKLPPSS